ncbi:MAG: hypothetical protein ACLPT6_02735, partial [Desulfobaccales bacterium]
MMAVDLSKALQIEPFGCVITTIGELCLFSISWGNQVEFRKQLGKSINEWDPAEFLRKYVRYVCFPKASLKEGKYKPDKPVLTDNEISSLTDDDLEKIAELYVVNNPYLFKELITKTEKNDKGEMVFSGEYGDVEYPKNEDETYTQYLFRLFIKKDEKESKLVGKTISSMIGLKTFSNGLGKSIQNTLSWGDSLRKTMESIRLAETPAIVHFETVSPEIDLTELARIKEQNRLRPFKDIAERLDKLIDASAQASEFMITANEIQTRIAGEIKSSADETRTFSKSNIILTIVVILLALFAIWQSNRDANIRRIETKEYINLLVGSLNKIDSSILADRTSKIENQQLRAQVEQQEKDIREITILLNTHGNKL